MVFYVNKIIVNCCLCTVQCSTFVSEHIVLVCNWGLREYRKKTHVSVIFYEKNVL